MIDDVSVVDYVNQVFGCTDATAFNYDPNATDDDGSCVWLGSDCSTAFTAVDGINTQLLPQNGGFIMQLTTES